MTVSKNIVLSKLPRFTDEWVKVIDRQDVSDIIDLIIQRHTDYAADYDKIGPLFIGRNLQDTCDNLVNFCAANIQYKEESEARQSVASPAAIISIGRGDCKHYASFIGGCLDAIARATGKPIKWYYCFASYDILQPVPYHVFVIVEDKGTEIYCDPTPGADALQPVYMQRQYISAQGKSSTAVNGLGELVAVGAASPEQYGSLIPAPVWYPANLPKFYRAGNGQILLRPLNAVPNYTENDVLDCLLYYQTIVGYNRIDNANAKCAAWKYSQGGGSGVVWVQSAFKADGNGNGSGDFAAVSTNGYTIDGAVYAKMQQRYIDREKNTMPWLTAMQGTGGGIDLMTLPMATDIEIERPSFYPGHLPSLFKSAGLPFQQPAGFLDSKPKIRNGQSSGFTQYTVTPEDIAYLMLYAQPVIAAGPSPYPVNWYINDDVNGAMAMYYKISLGSTPGHTNAQMQRYGYNGDLMKAPDLSADPYTSGFSKTLQSIVSAAVNFFAGKIPGGSTLMTAGKYAAAVSGGTLISGGPVPAGQFSASVFQAADNITADLNSQETTKNYLLIALLVLAGLGYYYRNDIKKYL